MGVESTTCNNFDAKAQRRGELNHELQGWRGWKGDQLETLLIPNPVLGLFHPRGLLGSETTIRRVQIGPKNKDATHQSKPLLPLDCARPALMSESVNQPTAYSPVLFMIFKAEVAANI